MPTAKHKKKKRKHSKPYDFLDVVVDVFYSIILYNVFIAFPGWNIDGFLMLFSAFVMLDYWWETRSNTAYPKYYLLDFYFMSIIMFIFSQWPSHFHNITNFLFFTALFFALDAIYALVSIPGHRETKDEAGSWYYVFTESILALVYACLGLAITKATPITIVILFIPYLLWFANGFRRRTFKTHFVDSGNEPY